MKTLFQKITNLTDPYKHLLFIFGLFVFIYCLSFCERTKDPSTQSKKVTLDTLIPENYVIYPIELTNAQAISHLIDQYGVVDIYTTDINTQRVVKVLSKVKIVRPSAESATYSVLIPYQLETKLTTYAGPYWAAVQNKQTQENNTNGVDSKKPSKVIVIESSGI